MCIRDSNKAEEIEIINIAGRSSIAEKFIIASCRSSRHNAATANLLTQKLKDIGIKCPPPEGKIVSDWIIVDTGSIIVHLFRPEIREKYKLEKLWDIGFDLIENQSA